MTPGLGPRITHARLAAGLSQDALAARLGVTRATVRWLERRTTRTVNAALLLPQIAEVCGVTLAYLEGRAPAPPAPRPADLGARIVVARVGAGLSQEELATRIGVDRHRLSRLEHNATKEPSVWDLVHIADVTGVDLSWLVGVTPPPPKEGDVVYIVCNEAREVRGVYDTYAKAYAWIDAVLREDGVVEGTPEWERRHARWDILQRLVQ